MTGGLVMLAALMGLATYPWRAVPLLAPGIHRLPSTVLAYLRLVGPAVLAALAAVNTVVTLGPGRHPSFHVGVEWIAVGICAILVVWRRNLLLGLLVGVVVVALVRLAGLAPVPGAGG